MKLTRTKWALLWVTLAVGMMAWGIIAAVNSVKPRNTSSNIVCINNMRQLDYAIQDWALSGQKPMDQVPTREEIAPRVKGSIIPVCPEGGTYTWSSANGVVRCSLEQPLPDFRSPSVLALLVSGIMFCGSLFLAISGRRVSVWEAGSPNRATKGWALLAVLTALTTMVAIYYLGENFRNAKHAQRFHRLGY